MTYEQFIDSTKNNAPPAGVNQHLIALWYAKKGDWKKAHDIAIDINGDDAARIHAYLHRQEGDENNAVFWYKRANVEFPKISLEEEFSGMIKEFIEKMAAKNEQDNGK